MSVTKPTAGRSSFVTIQQFSFIFSRSTMRCRSLPLPLLLPLLLLLLCTTSARSAVPPSYTVGRVRVSALSPTLVRIEPRGPLVSSELRPYFRVKNQPYFWGTKSVVKVFQRDDEGSVFAIVL
jgi:hypothetical protein